MLDYGATYNGTDFDKGFELWTGIFDGSASKYFRLLESVLSSAYHDFIHRCEWRIRNHWHDDGLNALVGILLSL